MQLITEGPDIPDEVLRAQEEDRLVFYCGAGISAGAGLPGYAKLVREIYEALGEAPKPAELEALGAEWHDPKAAPDPKALYDRALSLLETRVGPTAVRNFVSKRLKIKNRKASPVHRALLGLSQPRAKTRRPRLVTTNYDLLFEITATGAQFPGNA